MRFLEEKKCAILLAVTLALAFCGPAAADEPNDPYLWLEEVEGEKALAWAEERSARDTAKLEAVPVFTEIHEKLLEIYTSSDRIPGLRSAAPGSTTSGATPSTCGGSGAAPSSTST